MTQPPALRRSLGLWRASLSGDAAVLLLVNASLPWLAAHGRAPGTRWRRTADVLVPGAALVLCATLLAHAGWTALGVAVALAAVGLALAPRRAAG